MKLPIVAAAVLAVLPLLAAGGDASQPANGTSRATFTPSGDAALPVGYREWRHVGTQLKPQGTSILDGKPTKTAEIMNAYVQPKALAIYQRTGKWPDGSQMVKEFTDIRVGDGCDANTLQCASRFGTGIFQGDYIGLGMMVKDAKRFPNAPGNWGYFSFGHQRPPYLATSTVAPTAQCSDCHVGLASDTDYVIVAAHVGLRDITRR